jgi:cyclophilin family peptidyl-prolyl cis-trans isomerase
MKPMKKRQNRINLSPIIVLVVMAILALPVETCAQNQASKNGENPIVKMQTSEGVITLELFTEEAPVTTANFLEYVESGFYADTIFHRVIPGFVIQGGGMTENLRQKQTRAPIVNESDNGLQNKRGTLSMARTADPDSATSQFFINLRDNANLDAAPGRPGYAVFAKVIDGMDVVDAIAGVKTGSRGFHDDVPARPVFIKKIELEE